MKGIRVHKPGGPEVMVYEDFELPPPGPGEARVRHEAIGVNYLDVYQRSGFYPPPSLPFSPGKEGAGVVTAVGTGVKDFKPGDRVAYVTTVGSYAEERNVVVSHLVKSAASDPSSTAAGMMLKGLTAQYLLRQTYRVQRGRHDPRPCRGRRRRADPLPVGQGAGRDRHRHRRLRGQGQDRQSRAPSTSSTIRERISPSASARSPKAPNARSSMTASARRPSRPRSTA